MTVPVASAIRRTYPDAFIAWAVEDRCAAVVDTAKLVNLRWEARRQSWKATRWSPGTWAEQIRFYAGLRKHRFDFGLDLQGHAKTALCLRLSGAKKRAAARGTDLLARRLNPIVPIAVRHVHVVERNLEVLRSLGDFAHDASPIMPRLEFEREWLRGALPSDRPLATVASSAGRRDKEIPMIHLEAAARLLMGEGYQVAFVGGPGDPSPTMDGVIDWVGKLPLERSMAAVAESSIHLSGDTGTGHIAAAYGVPVVSVFGPMAPFRYRPYSEKAVVLKEGEDAASVPLERILEAVRTVLERYVREVPD